MTNGKRHDGRIRLVLIDDHPTIREALLYAVEDELDIVLCGQAANVQQAFDLVASEEPDVAIVDIMLADGYGLDLIGRLKTVRPELRFVVFSMLDETVFAARALRAGAHGYLMKSAPTREVIQAIRSVMQDRVYVSSQAGAHMMRGLGRGASPASPVEDLSDRELAVLQMLGQGFMMSEITDLLSLSRKTVETYRRRATEKLGLETTAALTHFAVQWVNAHPSGR